MVLGLILTAVPVVNAIPAVVAAPPGIVTYSEMCSNAATSRSDGYGGTSNTPPGPGILASIAGSGHGLGGPSILTAPPHPPASGWCPHPWVPAFLVDLCALQGPISHRVPFADHLPRQGVEVPRRWAVNDSGPAAMIQSNSTCQICPEQGSGPVHP